MEKNKLKSRFSKVIFSLFFAVLGVSSLFSGFMTEAVYADPNDDVRIEMVEPEVMDDEGLETEAEVEEEPETEAEEEIEAENEAEEENTTRTSVGNSSANLAANGEKSCKQSLGVIGWLVCPATGAITKAVDWLYEKIENILVIEPISVKDGSPIYEIWKYCRGLTNIVFIIFLLVVIYSQITGLGISNYGIKKALPKLIVAAVLINLSFLICSLAVDVSNVIGNGLRGVFSSIAESAVVGGAEVTAGGDLTVEEKLSYAGMYSSLAGGAALSTVWGVIALELGAIWMLIPVALGAIVSVVSGLVTIALRQAVVVLLIMISPLAIVACILPSTDKWFKKWKDLLAKMLIFYPMFSLLFGASNLAGFAIIASAKDGFGLLLGTAVQIFPLFFSWNLMKMSGTFLGAINAKMNAIAARPFAMSQMWANSHQQLTRQRMVAKGATPSTKLMQFLSNRRVAREEELGELAVHNKLRGQAYAANRNYRRNGTPSREGEEAYARQAQDMVYTNSINRHKNNMNAGLGQLEVVRANATEAQKTRLHQLDIANVEAADSLKMELARGAKIEFDNTKGYYERMNDAKNAHLDYEALRAGNKKYQMHRDKNRNSVLTQGNLARYEVMRNVMEGVDDDVEYIMADAAHSYEAHSQIVRGKFEDRDDKIEATQDIVYELNRLTKNENAGDNIDRILAGVRVLIKRGDTDLAWDQIDNVLKYGHVEIGSHALQAISNFCMFDVKGSDPAMRRFGKYINLETAKMFNEDDPTERRTRRDISLYEYINGEYINRDANGNVIYRSDGQPDYKKTRKSARVLLKGTSFRDIERTAMPNFNRMIRNASLDLTLDENGREVGTFNYEKFKENLDPMWDAIMPNLIGDHLSLLSGSEAIMAVGKALTGIDVDKHSFDFKGIFGEDIAKTLTPEQKKDFIGFLHERTKKFLSGQVAVQIARTKSDMLDSIRNQYTLVEAMKSEGPERERKVTDLGSTMTDGAYKDLENKHFKNIQAELRDSYKDTSLEGCAKMVGKGFAGESKDNLAKLLGLDELYERVRRKEREQSNKFNNRNNNSNENNYNEKEDGKPVDADDGRTKGMGRPTYNATRKDIEDKSEEYTGERQRDVKGFWEEVKGIIMDSEDIFGSREAIDSIDDTEEWKGYTDVTSFCEYIIGRLFGEPDDE